MIPATLKNLHQWVQWRYEERDGKPTKTPYQPSGPRAKSNDRTTWSTFDEVNVNGQFVGFVFAPSGGFFGIDLDDCLVKGELTPWAAEIIDHFPGAYVEVSPSGTGVKLFCAGDYEGRGRKHKFGEGRQAVELYGTGRYFAVTGEAIHSPGDTIGDCSDGLKWLLEKYWPASTAAKVTYSPPAFTGNIERRAAGYLSTIEPTRCGTASCHDRTFYAAGVLYWGFAMEVAEALPLLVSWAESGEHRWSVAELERKINEVAKRGCEKPRGWALAERKEEKTVKIDWDNLNGGKIKGGDGASVAPETQPAPTEGLIEVDDDIAGDTAKDPGPFPEVVFDRLSGFIGAVYRFIVETARYPQPELSLAAAISLMAVICGRKVRDKAGTRPGVYILGVNVSSSGKDHPRKVNKDILFAADKDTQLVGPEGFASSAGLLRAVKDYPSILFQIDEIGRMVATMRDGSNPHLYKIGGELLKLYSSSNTIYKGEAHADAKHDINIPYPCVTLFGTHTPQLFDTVTLENVSEGLLGRFMLFEGRGFVDSREDVTESPAPSEIVEWVKRWQEFKTFANAKDSHDQSAVLAYTDDASRRFRSHVKAIEEKRKSENEGAAILWSRTAEKTAKLALLFAASRIVNPATDTTTITVDDVDLAVMVSNWTTRKMVYNVTERVSDSRIEALSKKLLRFISHDRSKPTHQRAITRAFRGVEGRVREDVLQSLIAGGLVESFKVETAGRPATAYLRTQTR